ncbi:MAG TPA: hypothetical protein VF803_02360 [Candidatus Paceibacterota bacterium]
MLPAIEKFIGSLVKKARDHMRALALEIPFIGLTWFYFFVFWLPSHGDAGSIIGFVLALCAPFLILYLLFQLTRGARWEYVWLKDTAKTEFCVLEIKLPEELTQTPYAMELVLRGIYQSGAGLTAYHNWRYGERPAVFSLELGSDEGRVHFYIWMKKKYKVLVENQIYAHYPTVQVSEVPDYTLKMPFDPAVITMTGVEFTLQKPDPFPIVTYVEVGLDKPGTKEEHKHDPFASVLEYLGSLGPGEHAWIQYIIRSHDQGFPCASSGVPTDPKTGKPVGIEEWAKIEVQKINDTAKSKGADGKEFIDFMKLSAVDRKHQEAIQMKLNKQLFEVGVRTLYIAKKDQAKSPALTSLASIFRSFEHGSSGRGLNGLKPVFWLGPFNVPWHDFMDIRKHMLWDRYYDAYITRQFFYPPHKHPFIVLNTEELATLYHFPGSVVRTPTLQRLPSKRGEAPANLPI